MAEYLDNSPFDDLEVKTGQGALSPCCEVTISTIRQHPRDDFGKAGEWGQRLACLQLWNKHTAWKQDAKSNRSVRGAEGTIFIQERCAYDSGLQTLGPVQNRVHNYRYQRSLQSYQQAKRIPERAVDADDAEFIERGNKATKLLRRLMCRVKRLRSISFSQLNVESRKSTPARSRFNFKGPFSLVLFPFWTRREIR